MKAENKELRQLLNQALEQNKNQAIQIAELQTRVFGRKRRPPTCGTPIDSKVSDRPAKQPRTASSYRRPVPPVQSITSEVAVPLPTTCTCGGSFNPVNITVHERFVEDIPLPALRPDYYAKLATKYTIERGVCLACGKATSGQDLGGQAVTLGPNVRLLVVHLVSVVGMSYVRVVQLHLSLYSLVVSGGEIAAIRQHKHQTWLPAYAQPTADIRAAPTGHADETPWPFSKQLVATPDTSGCQIARRFVTLSPPAVARRMPKHCLARHRPTLRGYPSH
ncbi:hypothetical protein IPL85_00080 [Candidatus Saccharibacteria bacterium]|nr:MAG: hypothetical protein IPL85_00080 [Candidatus Saccharibacteria bacterium]